MGCSHTPSARLHMKPEQTQAQAGGADNPNSSKIVLNRATERRTQQGAQQRAAQPKRPKRRSGHPFVFYHSISEEQHTHTTHTHHILSVRSSTHIQRTCHITPGAATCRRDETVRHPPNQRPSRVRHPPGQLVNTQALKGSTPTRSITQRRAGQLRVHNGDTAL